MSSFSIETRDDARANAKYVNIEIDVAKGERIGVARMVPWNHFENSTREGRIYLIAALLVEASTALEKYAEQSDPRELNNLSFDL